MAAQVFHNLMLYPLAIERCGPCKVNTSNEASRLLEDGRPTISSGKTPY